MKKIICLLLCAWLLIPALAESGLTADNAMQLNLNGRTIPLEFDSTEGYSSIVDGIVQASFFAYTDNSVNLYELYLMFPEGVQPGTVIDQEYAIRNAPECSVVLIVTDQQTEKYYIAGQVDGAAYPAGSSYSLQLDSVTTSDAGVRYEGRLTATLRSFEASFGTDSTSAVIGESPFSFTMPAANRREAGNNPFADPTEHPTPGESFAPTPAPEYDFPSETPTPFDDPFRAMPTPTVEPTVTPLQTWRV